MRPCAGQPRQIVTVARKLHLKHRLPGPRAFRKDIQDDLLAVEHFHGTLFFNIALLRRTEFAVENQDGRTE